MSQRGAGLLLGLAMPGNSFNLSVATARDCPGSGLLARPRQIIEPDDIVIDFVSSTETFLRGSALELQATPPLVHDGLRQGRRQRRRQRRLTTRFWRDSQCSAGELALRRQHIRPAANKQMSEHKIQPL